jgi:hypothetical protein
MPTEYVPVPLSADEVDRFVAARDALHPNMASVIWFESDNGQDWVLNVHRDIEELAAALGASEVFAGRQEP